MAGAVARPREPTEGVTMNGQVRTTYGIVVAYDGSTAAGTAVDWAASEAQRSAFPGKSSDWTYSQPLPRGASSGA